MGMRANAKETNTSEVLMPLGEFLEKYNANVPASFPQASVALLRQFKESHPALFKHGELWSLDQHRKKFMDWVPRG